MTAVSGLSRSFVELAAARIGVGIGEASATPAAFSLLSDYFPATRRATVLAISSSGIYIGAGIGLGIGGLLVSPGSPPTAPLLPSVSAVGKSHSSSSVCRASCWRSSSLRSASRFADRRTASSLRRLGSRSWSSRRSSAVIPPFTLLHLWLVGAGAVGLARNVAAAVAITAAAALLVAQLGNPPQWIALGIGLYAAFSWSQSLAMRDPVAFALIFTTPSLRYAAVGFSFLAFAGYGIGFWSPPFFVRIHGIRESEAGLVLGGTAALAGWLGATAGGILADRWRRASPFGRLYVGLVTALAPMPFASPTC